MTTIYKYELELTPNTEQVLRLPRNAPVLSVGKQNDELYVWAKVNTEEVNIPRKFIVAWTGKELPESIAAKHSSAVFYGTVQIDYLVYHIFEVH